MDKFDRYFFYDLPVEYKGLLIYPVLMKDYIDFHLYVNCLLFDKNSNPDINIIQSSYLRYLCNISKEDSPALYMCLMLLKMVLRLDDEEDIKFFIEGDYKAYFIINEKKYTDEDFNNIKEIICKQNEIPQIDETINKNIRDALEKAEQYKMQQNANKICSLEDQMICVLISTSLKLEDIYDLSIRKFIKILKRIDLKMHYQIYLSASMTGMVEFKDKNFIKHWMNDLTQEDKYKDAKIDTEDMHQKIDNINK